MGKSEGLFRSSGDKWIWDVRNMMSSRIRRGGPEIERCMDRILSETRDGSEKWICDIRGLEAA